MIADLDTRCGELYASGDELMPPGRLGAIVQLRFARSREQTIQGGES